jgi:hypothetical protein
MAMTEQQWLASDDLYIMLWFLKGKDSDRKMRLFATSCCRRVWRRLTDQRSRNAIETAERYIEGEVNDLERETSRRDAKAAMLAVTDLQEDPAWALRGELIALTLAERVTASLLMWLFNENAQKQNPTGENNQKKVQADLLRDLFGPLLFRRISFKRAWRTANVASLAQSIYTDRAFDRLPILADALEDAGCDNADILNHCRQPGEHVRGCWVVDLVLGKS